MVIKIYYFLHVVSVLYVFFHNVSRGDSRCGNYYSIFLRLCQKNLQFSPPLISLLIHSAFFGAYCHEGKPHSNALS